MRVDLYTKAVLTVIAAALVYLCVAITPVGTPLDAQGETLVRLVGFKDRMGSNVGFSTESGLPVVQVGRPPAVPIAEAAVPLAVPAPAAAVAAPRSLAAPAPARTSARCQATTQKGSQCSRSAKAGSNYCWQHGGEE